MYDMGSIWGKLLCKYLIDMPGAPEDNSAGREPIPLFQRSSGSIQ